MSARTTSKAKPKRAPSNGATRKAKASKSAPIEDVWTLRLYITGRGERSERALHNLQQLCANNMREGTYKIEVIDLLKNPELAKILAIPTLVRKLPEPMKRVIGDLSNADRALLSMDFPKSQG